MTIRKLELMHQRFGVCEGQTCGTCKNLTSHFYDKRYYKCACYGESASEATDWAKRWVACGLWNKDYTGVNGVYFVKHAPKKIFGLQQIEGQMDLLGGQNDQGA